MKINRIISLSLGLFLLVFSGCNSSSLDDALDLAEGIPRKDIDTSIMGVNAFVNDGRFGAIESQFREVRDVLRLQYVRVLMAWNSAVQSSPGTAPDFSFYDDILNGLPSGVEALIVLTGVPDWMQDPANWNQNNPRLTFVESWVRKVAARYAGRGRVVGFQIWNEPNDPANDDNIVMQFVGQPDNYVEMLAAAHGVISGSAPSKLVVTAATTAINQNYPDSLDYNRAMRDAGAQQFASVWAVHYYGKQFENVVRNGGVADFLNGLSLPIWMTESGAQGVNEQLAYVEQAWPYLKEKIPGIRRFYYYQFTEATAPGASYGLRTADSTAPVSDLYVFLRDRQG